MKQSPWRNCKLDAEDLYNNIGDSLAPEIKRASDILISMGGKASSNVRKARLGMWLRGIVNMAANIIIEKYRNTAAGDAPRRRIDDGGGKWKAIDDDS